MHFNSTSHITIIKTFQHKHRFHPNENHEKIRAMTLTWCAATKDTKLHLLKSYSKIQSCYNWLTKSLTKCNNLNDGLLTPIRCSYVSYLSLFNIPSPCLVHYHLRCLVQLLLIFCPKLTIFIRIVWPKRHTKWSLKFKQKIYSLPTFLRSPQNKG